MTPGKPLKMPSMELLGGSDGRKKTNGLGEIYPESWDVNGEPVIL